jgi:manganese oxidase
MEQLSPHISTAAMLVCLCGMTPQVLVPSGSAQVISPGHTRVENTEPGPAVANDNRTAAGTLDNGRLELRMEARLAAWRPHLDVDSAKTILAFAEVGRAPSVPGPLLRVPQGTEVRITVRNAVPSGFMIGLPAPRQRREGLSSLAGPTLVVHGLRAGTVADDTVRVAAGATREVRFRAEVPGTYFYWGAMSDATLAERTTRDSQLTGAIVVDPASVDTPNDRIFVITMLDAFPDSTESPPGEDAFGPAINGLAWPHTERFHHAVGDTVLWRWVNGSGFDHPMHLHGFHFRTLARGDAASDMAFPEGAVPTVVTELMRPGDTFRMEWTPTRAGNWLMHCHFVGHIVPGEPRDEATRAHDLHDVTHHAMTAMDGLVLGITVSDTAGVAVLPPLRQRIRLIAQERLVPGEDALVRGFVLQENARPQAENITVPGPPLVLTRGERTEITVVNRLTEPTTIHWHGMELESVFDGVAGWSRTGSRVAPLVASGDSFVVSMTPPRAGTFIYHTHMDETEQLESGMYGPLLVLEPGASYDPEVDRVLVVGGSVEGWLTLNGQAEPEPITLEAGTEYRLRIINIHKEATVDIALAVDGDPVHWRALAKDGADLPPASRREQRAEVRMGVGETYDFLWTPTAPGEATLRVHAPFPTWVGSLEVYQSILIR